MRYRRFAFVRGPISVAILRIGVAIFACSPRRDARGAKGDSR